LLIILTFDDSTSVSQYEDGGLERGSEKQKRNGLKKRGNSTHCRSHRCSALSPYFGTCLNPRKICLSEYEICSIYSYSCSWNGSYTNLHHRHECSGDDDDHGEEADGGDGTAAGSTEAGDVSANLAVGAEDGVYVKVILARKDLVELNISKDTRATESGGVHGECDDHGTVYTGAGWAMDMGGGSGGAQAGESSRDRDRVDTVGNANHNDSGSASGTTCHGLLRGRQSHCGSGGDSGATSSAESGDISADLTVGAVDAVEVEVALARLDLSRLCVGEETATGEVLVDGVQREGDDDGALGAGLGWAVDVGGGGGGP